MKKIFTLIGLCFFLYNSDAQLLKKLKEKIDKAMDKTTSDVIKLLDKKTDSTINKNADNIGSGAKKMITSAVTIKSNSRPQDLKENEEIIYSTDFNFPDNFWYDERNYVNGGEISTSVKNGAYTISNHSKELITSIIDLKVNINRNFCIETSAAVIAGADNHAFGINFGQQGQVAGKIFPFNSFVINLQGAYSLFAQKNVNEFDNIINFTNTSSIKTRAKYYNKLRLEKIGSEISLYINDVKVTTEEMFANKTPVSFYGNYIGFYVGSLQEVSFDYFIVKYMDAKPKLNATNSLVKNDNIPPVININKPNLNSDASKITQKNKTITISGIAKDDNGIYAVDVNGKEAQVDEKGNFTATIPLVVGDNLLIVSAKDGSMNESRFQFIVNREAGEISTNRGVGADNEEPADLKSPGKYYALIIGVQKYQDKDINSLDQPIGDATSLYNVLLNNYSFEKENIFFLKNPTRSDMFKAFDDLQTKVTENDNVLIFYAGHGFWDKVRNQGYWLPSDAGNHDRTSWISNADLKDNITVIKSRHTLLITDACFAGGIIKNRSLAGASKAINELYRLESRKAMTSGMLTEVPDKSIFIEQLVKHLKNNTEKYLSARQLYASFNEIVTNNSPTKQVPEYEIIREAGDEGGDFIFIKK